MLVYGHSGTGKTRLIGTFAEAGPLLHLVCSSNSTNEALSIRGTKGVDVVEIKEPGDITELVEHARDSGKYVTVALDHVTEFCNLVLARIIGVEKLPEQSSWGLATMQQYQQMAQQVKEYLRDLLDLETNVVIAGQQRTFDAQEEGGEIIMPYVSVAASPSIVGWITPACDYIVQTFRGPTIEKVQKKIGKKTVTKTKKSDTVKYQIRTGPSEVYTTKFRVPPGMELPDVIVDPSYEKLKPLLT